MEKIEKEKKIGYLLGDFNLDLLKSDIHNPTLDFLNSLFSHSFWPLITRPKFHTQSSTIIQLPITEYGLELCFKWIWHKQGLLNNCAYL